MSASRSPSREDVYVAYRTLLGREPESENTIAYHQRHASLADLYHALATCAEFTQRVKSSPFFHYNSCVDVVATINAHSDPARAAKPGHVVNFLGVAMATRFMEVAKPYDGLVTEPPIPANFHADMAEFGAALRAVDLAGETFTVIELGCGWGCWMVNTAVAARRRGKRIQAIGVEGDRAHCDFAVEAMATNGISKSEYTLHHGVAAATGGTALFPKPDRAGAAWGSEPVFGATPDQVQKAMASGHYDQVPMVALADVIGERPRIDLLHMDIQGGEADLVHECLELVTQRVAYIVVGTHSREIEGRIFHDLLSRGWKLEIERPAILSLGVDNMATTVDGVQGWRNPALARAA